MSRTLNLETLKIPSCSPQNTHNILQDQLTRRPGQKHPEHRPSNLENHLRKLSPPTLKINPSNLIYLTSQPCYSLPCISTYPSQNSQDPQEPLRPPRSRFCRWIVPRNARIRLGTLGIRSGTLLDVARPLLTPGSLSDDPNGPDRCPGPPSRLESPQSPTKAPGTPQKRSEAPQSPTKAPRAPQKRSEAPQSPTKAPRTQRSTSGRYSAAPDPQGNPQRALRRPRAPKPL
ncbi:hypothetical protein PGT21_014148 [Puccinia graminis f. sp. tritici]|uniref:Uncharacterized protein n=1 Tax=Puccinia graminis f. sp. tritici TaxID=56615 RepID=A0A5B0ND51_PUCGR|nr:hypothetical protein PGT21_014148 [Puccinia graminis f. sp. tritici]